MKTYYVATRSTYVLVDADDEAHARELGLPALGLLMREKQVREVPVQIHTVRPATADEIELMKWQECNLAREVC